jgi:hypothetical protein
MRQKDTMTIHFSKPWIALPLMLLPFLLAACQATGGQTAVDGTSSVADNSLAEEAEPEVLEVDLVLGPGNFDLTDPLVGLDELASYKATLTVIFDGSQDGQPYQWSSTYILLNTKEPQARLLTIENSGDLAPAEPDFMAEADGAAYETDPEGNCSADRIDVENSRIDWQNPAGLLDGLLGAEEAGQETMNEVAADHYTFDERALREYGFSETDGEIWVATDGGYLLKYQRATTGNVDYFHNGIEGTVTWDYQLTEIDQPLELVFPEGCRVDAPLMADAFDVLNLPGWLLFNTASSVADTAAFYQEQLPALGWTLTLQPIIAETAIFEYIQGEQTLSLIISPGGAGTRVDISLGTVEQ